MITSGQQGCAFHSLSCTKSSSNSGISSRAGGGSVTRAMSLFIANSISTSSIVIDRMSKLRGQSRALCPGWWHWKQVREVWFLCWPPSISIGTGLPRVGWECAMGGRECLVPLLKRGWLLDGLKWVLSGDIPSCMYPFYIPYLLFIFYIYFTLLTYLFVTVWLWPYFEL